MKPTGKFFLLQVCCFIYNHSFSQSDSSVSFVGVYYGLGVANPIGSFSHDNAKYNDIGKSRPGLNMKAGLEVFVTPKDVVSLDFDYGFYFGVRNDSIEKVVERRVNSYKTPYIEVGDKSGDAGLSQVCVGYSRSISFGRLIFQPKIGVGLARFSFDYATSFALSNILSGTVTSVQSATTNALVYAFSDYDYYTLKPEITLKYVLKEGKCGNLNLVFGVSYFYANPSLTLFEKKDSDVSSVLTLSDKVQSLNFNLGVNFVMKKFLFRSILN